MIVLSKRQAQAIIRRAYGGDVADSVVIGLPDRIDLDNAADVDLLYKLGVSRDRLFDALGAEL